MIPHEKRRKSRHLFHQEQNLFMSLWHYNEISVSKAETNETANFSSGCKTNVHCFARRSATEFSSKRWWTTCNYSTSPTSSMYTRLTRWSETRIDYYQRDVNFDGRKIWNHELSSFSTDKLISLKDCEVLLRCTVHSETNSPKRDEWQQNAF